MSSRFFSNRLSRLTPYTPGEQPRERKYIKLNTNESPYPPSEKAVAAASEAAKSLQLYSDPACTALTKAVADDLGLSPDEVLLTNGSDEILNFAFMAFCDQRTPAAFADITYGFYKVFAELNCVPYDIIPLKDDLSIDVNDYMGINKTIFIANPNAPTGMLLSVSDIERILKSNPDNVVVVDEAYIDFGGESCVPLVRKYDNLLVTRTFSKSRSMAGARLGFGVGAPSLIADLNTIKYSTNPYNVNGMTQAAGLGVMADEEYTAENCRKIIETRAYVAEALRALGFDLTESMTNFIFARHPRVGGGELYSKLREKGILVRHFESERICEYNRITVGSREEMERFVEAVKEILEEIK